MYEDSLAEGEICGSCPGRLASEVLAQRLLLVCPESGEGVPSEDLLAMFGSETADNYFEEEPSIRILVKPVDNQYQYFMDCIEEGRVASLRLFLNAGISPNFEYSNSTQTALGFAETPLGFAASCGREAVVKMLIEAGANLEGHTKCGQTALLMAAGSGHVAEVRILLEAGANMETRDIEESTPLIDAAGEGHEAVVQMLLEAGANLEARDKYGVTPLLEAALGEHDAVVRVLLKAGAKGDPADVSHLRNTRVRDYPHYKFHYKFHSGRLDRQRMHPMRGTFCYLTGFGFIASCTILVAAILVRLLSVR